MVDASFQETAVAVLGALLPDYASDELARCVAGAYGLQWDDEAIAPVTSLGADWLLELYHASGRLVKEEDLGVGGQGADDLETPLGAIGKVAGLGGRKSLHERLGDAEQLEGGPQSVHEREAFR